MPHVRQLMLRRHSYIDLNTRVKKEPRIEQLILSQLFSLTPALWTSHHSPLNSIQVGEYTNDTAYNLPVKLVTDFVQSQLPTRQNARQPRVI
jgi:hypothetical protein